MVTPRPRIISGSDSMSTFQLKNVCKRSMGYLGQYKWRTGVATFMQQQQGLLENSGHLQSARVFSRVGAEPFFVDLSECAVFFHLADDVVDLIAHRPAF